MNREKLGKEGENKAQKYLESQGYFILIRNFKCTYGEIDIIATDKDELVFVEVKTRASKEYGQPRDAVNTVKRKHMKKTATYFIGKNKLENRYIRFDVIEVYFKENKFYINHIKNTLW